MHDFLQKMERFAKNPHLDALVGIVLLTTGIVQAGDTLVEDVLSGRLGAIERAT